MNEYKSNLIQGLQNSEIEYLVTVPTSGMNEVYEYFEKLDRCIYVSREEEGVAIASGLALGSKKVLMFIQQSGVGNMLNALFTLADPYKIPFTILVMIRGEEDENPIHWLSSKRTTHIINDLEGINIDWNDITAIKKFKTLVKGNQRWIISNY